jgi:hypothetical protein
MWQRRTGFAVLPADKVASDVLRKREWSCAVPWSRALWGVAAARGDLHGMKSGTPRPYRYFVVEPQWLRHSRDVGYRTVCRVGEWIGFRCHGAMSEQAHVAEPGVPTLKSTFAFRRTPCESRQARLGRSVT